MFSAVLFDLDNTLLDFWNFKQEAARAAAKAMIKKGLPEKRTRYTREYSKYTMNME